MTPALLVAALAVPGAYWVGRVRLGRFLLSWAEDRSLGPHGLAWWASQAVGLAAVAWMLTIHPRRSAAIPRVRRAPAPREED